MSCRRKRGGHPRQAEKQGFNRQDAENAKVAATDEAGFKLWWGGRSLPRCGTPRWSRAKAEGPGAAVKFCRLARRDVARFRRE